MTPYNGPNDVSTHFFLREKDGEREEGDFLVTRGFNKMCFWVYAFAEQGQITLITAPNSYGCSEYFNYEAMKSGHSATHMGNKMQPMQQPQHLGS